VGNAKYASKGYGDDLIITKIILNINCFNNCVLLCYIIAFSMTKKFLQPFIKSTK